jgi:hypothetical protein
MQFSIDLWNEITKHFVWFNWIKKIVKAYKLILALGLTTIDHFQLGTKFQIRLGFEII